MKNGNLLYLNTNKATAIGLEEGTISQFEPQASSGSVLTPEDLSSWSTLNSLSQSGAEVNPVMAESETPAAREKMRYSVVTYEDGGREKYQRDDGRCNTLVIRIVDDGDVIRPVSAHIKDVTMGWLMDKKRLVIDEDGQLFMNRAVDNSASHGSRPAADTENQSAGSVNSISQSAAQSQPQNGENPEMPESTTTDNGEQKPVRIL